MTEQKEIYRIINPSSLEDLANQVNRILAMQADRQDSQEGRRGTPRFHAQMNMSGFKIANADKATVTKDVMTKDNIADISHHDLADLDEGDDHTQYALLAGREGGQELVGGTEAGEDLTLSSTADSSKGDIILEDQTRVKGLKIYDSNNVLIHGFITD